MAERSYSVSEVGVGGGGREELPRVRGWGGYQRSYPTSEVRGGGREELPHAPMPEARGGGQEEQPHIQGALAA